MAVQWKPPSPEGSAVYVEGAVKTFGKVTALRGVDLRIERGQLFGIIGPNGAGKSTLIRSLIGNVSLDKGRISVLGLDPEVDPLSIKAHCGIVPESESPPSFLTPEEFLDFVMHVRGAKPRQVEKERLLSFFDMESNRSMIARDLSKGTRQKLMLAGAFIHEPPLLLLDEPFINLDPIYQRKVKDYLTDYVRGGGTILLSTHILALAQELCERVAIIHKGEILKVDGTHGLIEKSGSLENAFLDLVGYSSGS